MRCKGVTPAHFGGDYFGPAAAPTRLTLSVPSSIICGLPTNWLLSVLSRAGVRRSVVIGQASGRMGRVGGAVALKVPAGDPFLRVREGYEQTLLHHRRDPGAVNRRAG